MWQVYLVLCSDGILYCGISRDVDVRLEEHNAGTGLNIPELVVLSDWCGIARLYPLGLRQQN